MKSNLTSSLKRVARRLALPGWAFLAILCFGATVLLFPPSIRQIVDPYVYEPGFRTPVSIFPYPVELTDAGACTNKCLIDVCVHWIPGPSDRCLHPGPGGGCCIEYQTKCDKSCEEQNSEKLTLHASLMCDRTGQNGWCIRNARLALDASDSLGYSVVISGDLDGTPFPNCNDSCTLVLPQGMGTAHYTAHVSNSGKTAHGSNDWKYDPEPPVTTISYPSASSVVKGTTNITGQSTDAGSGVADTQISFDGSSWTSLSSLAGDWSFPWDTSSLPNGPFTIYAMGIDQAGNVGSPNQVSVILDNHPPHLTVPSAWTLPQSGGLSVSPNVTPLKDIKITIQDLYGRFQDRVIFDGLPAPPQITWDGNMKHILAPPGSYSVLVQACDVYDVCAVSTSLITVPAPTSTAVPSPTTMPSPTSLLSAVTSTPVPTLTVAVLPMQFTPTPLPALKKGTRPPASPIWPIAFPALFLLMFTALLFFDPRPAALHKLSRTINQGVKNVSNRNNH